MTVMKTENINTETTEKRNLPPRLFESSSDTKSNQLYESIVNDIQIKSDGRLSKGEANIAAQNLVEFVKIMINQLEDDKKH